MHKFRCQVQHSNKIPYVINVSCDITLLSAALLDMLLVAGSKYSPIYKTPKYVTLFSTTRHFSISRATEFSPHTPVYFFQIYFNIIFPNTSYAYVLQVVACLQILRLRFVNKHKVLGRTNRLLSFDTTGTV
jgi:hypothetical protein